MVRIKICGLTRANDALEAARLGADAIGLVFYPESPRYVSLEQARQIIAVLPPFVSVVALFVDASLEKILQVIQTLSINVVQLHGQESAEFCRQLPCKVIKALRVSDAASISSWLQEYGSVDAVLLDTHVSGIPGGTGKTFDWSCIPEERAVPVIVAGGLNPENVGDCIQQVRPYAVDVSGGVESSPGIKSSALMQSFVNEARQACHRQ
ncbi:MAG: phosphoribosylanthranilate isomerase [Gammaproteobacteria bacterium]|nr:MAG: phosphoribosylanthranilate isomerase [Gammaproteobacteria bacterium]